MKRTTTERANAAALALKLANWQQELVAQRTLFEHLIDRHEWELQNYRAIAPLFGIKR